MLSDWTYWLSSVPRPEFWLLLCPLLLFDVSRYFAGCWLLWLVDGTSAGYDWLRGAEPPARYDYCPTVCVVVAGLNEGSSVVQTLRGIWDSYPRLEIIVVDDGSQDDMSPQARQFASTHAGVRVVTKQRGGKSSAMNTALPLTTAEVVIVVDADSELAPSAVWEIVQPLADPRVGAVSGNVLVRNRKHNLLTRLQTLEYLRSIALGRRVSARLGILGIVSGAFGAFRRAALQRVGGWDVGPGEDEDIVLRIRKLGYRVEFAPDAECYTDVPTSLRALSQQRRRWEWAVITFESRKHIDLADPRLAHFHLANFALVMERWLFNLFLPLVFWLYLGWLLLFSHRSAVWPLLALFYLIYVALEGMLWLLILYYSPHPRRELALGWLVVIMPLYQSYQRCVTTLAIVEEMLCRRSYRDTFVPQHVRHATWRW